MTPLRARTPARKSAADTRKPITSGQRQFLGELRCDITASANASTGIFAMGGCLNEPMESSPASIRYNDEAAVSDHASLRLASER
jgi:hypothetical protein